MHCSTTFDVADYDCQILYSYLSLSNCSKDLALKHLQSTYRSIEVGADSTAV